MLGASFLHNDTVVLSDVCLHTQLLYNFYYFAGSIEVCSKICISLPHIPSMVRIQFCLTFWLHVAGLKKRRQ